MIFSKDSNHQWQWWLIITLAVSLIYSTLGLRVAFQGDWIVQDDARQHVFWMMRYLDPDLFPNDLIADYFQSVAPFGYTSLYKLAASLGIDPLVFNKLIPIALRLVVTYYFFLLCRAIFDLPIGCAIATLLFNHNIWLKDDIISATPRAFLYPFLIAFLYYLTQESLIPCLIAIILLSLFYPQGVLLVSVISILRLINWQDFKPTVTTKTNYQYFSFVCLSVAFIVMLPYAINTSEYAPVISRGEAFNLPEFHEGGRSNFFKDSIFEYLVGRGNAVLISTGIFNPIILFSGLFFPLIITQRERFTLAKKVTHHLDILIQLAIASLVMYILAHIMLFRLHLPSRYTNHSLRIILAIFSGITITVVFDYLLNKIKHQYKSIIGKILAGILIVAIILMTYSSIFEPTSPTGYKIGDYPALYQFFRQQPQDIVIASLATEADNLPTFTRQSILVGREYAIPYQLGYYKPFSQKVRDLITAQYSNNLELVQQFIRQYKINFLLIEDDSFTPQYFTKNRWLNQYREESEAAVANLKNSQTSIVEQLKNSCQVFSDNDLTVIDTECLLNK